MGVRNGFSVSEDREGGDGSSFELLVDGIDFGGVHNIKVFLGDIGEFSEDELLDLVSRHNSIID